MSRIPSSLIQWAAQAEGVDPALYEALLTQESGATHARGGRLVTSPAGAIGAAQLMPGTARGLGVNPRDLRQNLRGGARYLSQQLRRFGGSVPKALAAYNAGPGAVQKYGGIPPYRETQNYVSRITSALAKFGRGPGQAVTPSAAAASPVESTGVAPTDPREALARRWLERRGTLGRAVAAKRFGTPSAAAEPQGYTDPVSPEPQGYTTPADRQGPAQLLGSPIDRPGVRTADSVIEFVRRISSLTGKPIQLGTGTQHNRMSKSGRQSAHWTGRAIDLPSSGAELTRMGQAALIAAGADPAWARRQRGGLFNVNGHQIIFNTNVGGNHFDHLHVGERG